METSLFSLLFVFLLGVVTGICLFGVGLWYVLSFFLLNPEQNDQEKLQQCQNQQPASATFQLPPVLQSKINDESFKAKENCWAFNFILYFLFRELRNSQQIRRWILRKLAMEFDEILATSILGKFFSSITIQSIDMGQNFPVINWLRTTKVELHPVSSSITTLDILVDITYSGGFTFAIQAETHLKHSAYLSVKIKDVKGKARLQFTTEPYAHWSISFTENPDIDIGVASQLYGKSFSQITSIIAAQLKRSVRKKHTLPMFKIRYKPFFVRMEHVISALLPQTSPSVQTTGSLSLTVVECHGLMQNLLQDGVYATVGIGDYDWVAIYPSPVKNNNVYIIRDVICVKTVKREANLDFTLMQQGDVPVIESINPFLSSLSLSQAVLGTAIGKPHSYPEIGLENGDEIISVDGKQVSSIKQCIKYFRGSASTKVVWRVRRQVVAALPSEKEMQAAAIGTDLQLGTAATHDEGLGFSISNTTISGNGASTPDSMQDNNDMDCQIKYLSFHSFPTDTRANSVCKTRVLRTINDPIFQDTFNFDIHDSQRFLNITLWTSKQLRRDESTDSTPNGSPAKKIKDNDFPFGKDKVLGCLSVPLIDILSECSTTGMGFFVKDYYLDSPDGNALDAREHNLKDHSGFDPHLCYGKVVLSFLYKSSEDDSKRKASLTNSNALNSKSEESVSRAGNGSPSEDGQAHQFVRAHFRSAAVCDYCNRKIWLKEAYTCGTCNMKCHKKCYERCVANTICRRDMYQAKPGLPPEIIMTSSDTAGQMLDQNTTVSDTTNAEEPENLTNEKLSTNGSATVRRRTLGGLIVSAVQNRSSQLRRVGSATALVPPTLSPNIVSKSLPPSPQVSPTFIRKGTVNEKNPFQILDSGSPNCLEENLKAAVDLLTANPNDDFVSLAKETGRDVFNGISLSERKLKLNHLLNRLQDEIDAVSNERGAFEKEEIKSSPASKTLLRHKIAGCEEKVKALAVLMLHYCAGLQHVQELEEQERDNERLHKTTGNIEPDGDEYSCSSGLLSNLSASTTCLIEQDEY